MRWFFLPGADLPFIRGWLAASLFVALCELSLRFSILIGGTTNVHTAGLLSAFSDARFSEFSLVSETKLLFTNGLSWPEESELGDPSTVSQPLSGSSSDILLGLLQGDGLDWPEELVLRVLSGLLREHTRSMFRVL